MSALDDTALERELSTPTYYLLGFNVKRRRWQAMMKGLVSFRRGSEIIDEGRPRYSRIMMVSQVEFRALGLPLDEEATEYFSLEGQRKVSDYYGSNQGSKKKRR